MPKENQPLKYLVTGANRGIGLAFARHLSERGDKVIATARHPEKARDLAKLSLRLEQLDVADEKSIASLARRIEGEPLDVLINNAGIGDAGPAFARLSMKELDQAFRVNATGPVAITQALLLNLRAGLRRTVVNLSSGLGSISENDSGGWIAYRASKAALNQLTRTMAGELRKEGFICIAICPGWVKTDMGGHGASVSPDDSVAAMLKVVDRLKPSDTGRFLDRRGKQLPW
ncbi:MAG TPA: SDR family oxidoreductase [Thermoanaerobaculia bacterium]|nr:SDR family oxidoreductase [Thermoanaerobaculia bacterium]